MEQCASRELEDRFETQEDRFEALMERGRAEAAADHLEDGLATFEAAEEVAKTCRNSIGADRAWLNGRSLLIAMQRIQEVDGPVLGRMRSILTAGDDALNSCIAAYDIAQIYELTKDYRKGLFYARTALGRARVLESREWLVLTLNQLGNLLLAESQLDEAKQTLEDALDLLSPDEEPARHALIVGNLGYIYHLLGRRRDGFRLLYESLRTQRRIGRRRDQTFSHLDLCFAHLEVERYRDALRHGMRALALAEELDEQVSIQQALFLLGEAAQLLGDREAARAHFTRLHEAFFPDNPRLPDLLLAVGIRGLVNLRA